VFDPITYPDLLVGLDVADDAAVWRINDERALVFTADFFTPVVDDPYDYGAIAAANALSDIYAMGGQPFLALNLTAMPVNLPEKIIAEIIRGAADVVREAGAVIGGGHTIDDEEPKFGLAALGWVHPDRVGTKAKAQPGDHIILTKPLGSGIITTVHKAGEAEPGHIETATRWMKQLNRDAAQALASYSIHAVTDITGFGLLGHGWEVAHKSGVQLQIQFDSLPFQPGAKGYADDLLFPAMANHNADDYGEHVTFAPRLEYEMQLLTFCPETSGGLFITLPPDETASYLSRYREMGHEAWIIGEVVEGEPHTHVL